MGFSFVVCRSRYVVVGLDVAVDIAVAWGDPRLVGESKYVLLRTNDRVEMGDGILLEGGFIKDRTPFLFAGHGCV